MLDDPFGSVDGERRVASGVGGAARRAEKGERAVDELDLVQSGYDFVLAVRSIAGLYILE